MAAYLRRNPAAAPAAVFLIAGFLLGVLWSSTTAPATAPHRTTAPVTLSAGHSAQAQAQGQGESQGLPTLRWLPNAQFTDSHTIHDGWFTAQVQVGVALGRVEASTGKFIVPTQCGTRLWVDVGAHGVPLRPSPVGFTVAFEPQVNQWHKHFGKDECILSLPMVANENSRLQELKVYAAGQEGSTSLNRVSESAREKWDKKWPGIAAEFQVQRVVHVPSVPLAEVLGRLPADWPVEFLKVDTQGHDLFVLKSAGDLLKTRVQWVKTEVPLLGLYEGQPSKQEILAYLAERGFVVVKTVKISEGFEEDIWLKNAGTFDDATLQRHADEILSQVQQPEY